MSGPVHSVFLSLWDHLVFLVLLTAMETVEVHMVTELSSAVSMQLIWRSRAEENRISRELTEAKNLVKRQKVN